jgi:hypothetical protein
MEISRHQFYVFDLDQDASVLSFISTDKSVAMTDDNYKEAIRKYARPHGGASGEACAKIAHGSR